MDLNICLYCEKLIIDDDETSFCSTTCRNRESKQETAGGDYCQSMLRPSNFHDRSLITPLQTPPLPPINYELAYHRRPSFSYSPISGRRASSSFSSSSINSFSSSSTLSFDHLKYFNPSIAEDALSYSVYTTP